MFNMVDALTRLSRQIVNAGDRTEVDQQAGSLSAAVRNSAISAAEVNHRSASVKNWWISRTRPE